MALAYHDQTFNLTHVGSIPAALTRVLVAQLVEASDLKSVQVWVRVPPGTHSEKGG